MRAQPVLLMLIVGFCGLLLALWAVRAPTSDASNALGSPIEGIPPQEDGGRTAAVGLAPTAANNGRVSGSDAARPPEARSEPIATEAPTGPTESSSDRPDNWISVTELSEASRAALTSARQELKRILELASETSTLAELNLLRDESIAKYDVEKRKLMGDRASQGFGDLYRVECDEQGNPIPPATHEMPGGHGQLIKMWLATEDPNVVRIVFLPFDVYRDIYELKWTADIIEDIMNDP